MSDKKEIYTSISTVDQIRMLEVLKLKPRFRFKFSLFFKSINHSRNNLFNNGKCVLFTRGELIDCGNLDGVKSLGFQKRSYMEFVNHISEDSK